MLKRKWGLSMIPQYLVFTTPHKTVLLFNFSVKFNAKDKLAKQFVCNKVY